jgi:putative ATPase
MDLFEKEKSKQQQKPQPLAVRMRPRTLAEYVGQSHIVGEGKLLRRAIEADRISSIILYGPPGSGKNALAYCISNVTKAYFYELNAVSSNVAELRKALEAAKKRLEASGQRTILFVDEIHRFNKAQQDVLMPDVEEGNVILIGATTHNPFFSIVSPLLSRSIIFQLEPLKEEDILIILDNAINDKERGLGKLKLNIDKEALAFLAKLSDGDARRSLNALEVGSLTTAKGKDGIIHYTLKVAEESIQKKAVVYDKDEDGHYDTISAFIKSMRGSDPDAALYWLAKMLYAGEDPRFIARRIVICAAEDVGNADPQAIVVANAAFQISEFVGMPEARIPLAQATVYIACAPKSNAAYMGIEKAMEDVEAGRTLEVPRALRDTNYAGSKQFGHGEGYQYSHSSDQHYIKQDFIPTKKKYYIPTQMGYEKKIADWLKYLASLGT